MIIVGALNIPNSLDAVHGLAVASCPGQSMLVLCRALECFFCWHCGVVRAECLGVGELRGGLFVHMVLVGPSLWLVVPGHVGSSAHSPQVEKRTMSTEAEPEMRANRATWLLYWKEKRETGDESRGSELCQGHALPKV